MIIYRCSYLKNKDTSYENVLLKERIPLKFEKHRLKCSEKSGA